MRKEKQGAPGIKKICEMQIQSDIFLDLLEVWSIVLIYNCIRKNDYLGTCLMHKDKKWKINFSPID